ncbi:hypothetical protein KJ975_04430, partial [Myxococcota bacterium]|nr:hypothetical protein [Myxococcota bacterium]
MAIPFLSKNSQINLCVKYIAEKYIINKQPKYWLGDARFREGRSAPPVLLFISCFPSLECGDLAPRSSSSLLFSKCFLLTGHGLNRHDRSFSTAFLFFLVLLHRLSGGVNSLLSFCFFPGRASPGALWSGGRRTG